MTAGIEAVVETMQSAYDSEEQWATGDLLAGMRAALAAALMMLREPTEAMLLLACREHPGEMCATRKLHAEAWRRNVDVRITELETLTTKQPAPQSAD